MHSRGWTWAGITALGLSIAAVVSASRPDFRDAAKVGTAMPPLVDGRESPVPRLHRTSPRRGETLVEAGEAASVARPASSSATETSEPESAPTQSLADELQWTEEAIAASDRLGERVSGEPQPVSERSELPSMLAAGFCGGRGLGCLSGSQCCAGLVCAGGVAGYGIHGRCEAPR